MIRTTKFGHAPSQRYAEYLMTQAESREEILDPTLGVHAGRAPYTLPPGFSPESHNFAFDAGGIRPRSGLSFDADSGAADIVLGGGPAPDLVGNLHAVVASQQTLSLFDATTGVWSALTPSLEGTLPSGTSGHRWRSTSIYDAGLDRNLGVLVNHKDTPKTVVLESGTTQFSDLTAFSSLASTARAVCAFDNRLVWFNVTERPAGIDTPYPQRVLWSPRGLPRDYQLANGAGFEDLLDMKGEGTAVLPENDGILLFSDQEIWRGRKRSDAYVFDFRPVSRKHSCPFPQTIAATPEGVVFLGRDLELYIVAGERVLPLGPAAEGDTSRIQTLLDNEIQNVDNAFGLYNPLARRYELYYPGPETENGYCTRALFYSLENRSFFPQTLGFETSLGFVLKEPDDPGPTFDQVATQMDSMTATFDTIQTAGLRYQAFIFRASGALSDLGTVYRYTPLEAADAGLPFEAYWRSHGLAGDDRYRWDTLREVWVAYDATAPGTLTVKGSDSMGDDFLQEIIVPLPAKHYGHALAPLYFSAPAPLFEIRLADGTRPRIARLSAILQSGGKYAG